LLPHDGQHPPHTTNRGHARHAHFCRYQYSTGAPGTGLTIGHGLSAAGLHRDRERNRIVAEKPLGNDLASFREINGVMTRWFHENRIYRIDHCPLRRIHLAKIRWRMVRARCYRCRVRTSARRHARRHHTADRRQYAP